MIRDPLPDYRRALHALIAWDHTAQTTGDPRHERAAAVCRAIAFERRRIAHAAPLSAADRAALAPLEQLAGLAASSTPAAVAATAPAEALSVA